MHILIVQLFWLSFIVIGFFETVFLLKLKLFNSSKNFIDFLRTTHVLVSLLIFWAIGASSFLIYIIPAYIFEWPISFLAFIYVFILICSIVLLFIDRKNWIMLFKKQIIIKKSSLIILLFIGGLVLLNYIISIKTGEDPYGDAATHIAKIYQIASGGRFTLADPYFGYNGVVQPGYSTNFLFAIESLVSYLFHINPVDVWKYSYSFVQLMLDVSIFSVLWVYLKNSKYFNYFCYLMLAYLPYLSNHAIFFTELPRYTNMIWFSLLFIGIKLLIEKDIKIIFFVAVILTATTHTFNATILTGFLSIILLIYGLLGLLNKKLFYPIFLAIIILMIPIIYALSYPTHLNPGYSLKVVHYGPFIIEAIPKLSLICFQIAVNVFFLIYLLNYQKIKTKKMRLMTHFFIIICLIISFNLTSITFVGFFYLIYINKNLKVRLLLSIAMGYYAMIVYNPIVVPFLVRSVPQWAVNRFIDINIFSFALPLLSFTLILIAPLLSWGYKRITLTMGIFILVLFVPLPFGNGYSTFLIQIPPFNISSNWSENLTTLDQIARLNNRTIFTNDPFLPVTIDDVSRIHIINNYGAGAAPMANYIIRDKCAETLNQNLRLYDLKAAGVNTVIAYKIGENNKFNKLASSKSYLKLVKAIHEYNIYYVNSNLSNNKLQSSSICKIPYGE